jgi:hypothetical protein
MEQSDAPEEKYFLTKEQYDKLQHVLQQSSAVPSAKTHTASHCGFGGVHVYELYQHEAQSRSALAGRSLPKLKSSTIRPILPHSGHYQELPWPQSINPAVTTCTYGDILLSITTALTKQHEKQQVDYVNVNEWIDHKLFLRELNSKSCSLHDGKHVVASATYDLILQFFCELQLFVLIPWQGSNTEVYVPVVEHVEEAIIAARRAFVERGWSTLPKSFGARAFSTSSESRPRRSAARHRSATPPADSDSDLGDDADYDADHHDDQSENESPPHKRAKSKKPVHIYSIAAVNQAQTLDKRVWTDKGRRHSWRWADARNDPDLATAIMQWQMDHHLQLRTTAVAAAKNKLKAEVVRLRHLNDELRSQLAGGGEQLDPPLSPPSTRKRKEEPPSSPPEDLPSPPKRLCEEFFGSPQGSSPAGAHVDLPTLQLATAVDRTVFMGKLFHKMSATIPATTCCVCSQAASPFVQCITCSSHPPRSTSSIYCLVCFPASAQDSCHRGHLWRVIYLPCDFTVVQVSTSWLPAAQHASVPSTEQVEEALEQLLQDMGSPIATDMPAPSTALSVGAPLAAHDNATPAPETAHSST